MKFIPYLLVLLLLGCTTHIQPELRQAVDEKLAMQRSKEVDCEASKDPSCAIQSPLLYLANTNAAKDQHHATLLDIGEDSLKVRLHLIRAAKQSIEFQNFLFRRDQTGALVVHELVRVPALCAGRCGILPPFALVD
jgi:putative cardiolipin synthase